MISSPSCSLGKISRMTDKILEDAMVFNYILNPTLLVHIILNYYFASHKVIILGIQENGKCFLRSMTTLRTVHELQQPKGQSRRDQGTPPDQVTIMFFLTKTVAFPGPLTSPDLPPTLWRTGREAKPRRIGINLQKNTIQVLQKNTGNSLIMKPTFALFQTVTEGAPVQVRKYQIERRIFQVAPFLKPW